MSDLKLVKIEGELFWPRWMGEFNTAFGDTERYECTIGNLTPESIENLKSIGVKIKFKDNKPEQGHFIVSKSKYPFEPMDSEKKSTVPLDMIGNGTKCVALVSSYEHRMSKQHGKAPSVKKIVITELKKYVPSEKNNEEDDIL